MTRFAALFLVVLTFALPVRAELNIQETTTAGGINAWLVEDHSIPFVALEIRFKGGTSLDMPGKRGATYLMSGLLEEGAGDLDAAAFRRETERLAANFGFDAHGDAVSISARFLTENRADAIELLRKAISEPHFDQVALDRVRSQVISIIASDKKDPNEIASRAFDAMAYGPDHPYGSPLTGTEASVKLLTREDMFEAHRNAMTRDRVYVAAVGDVTPGELGYMLDILFGSLPKTGS
ncbi:MAG: M16 family metallopeptidase, partial [Paracoccaceae bacterium]